MTKSDATLGIYVRIGYPESDVLLLTGHELIELAYGEAEATHESIAETLLNNNYVINYHHAMYNEYGMYLGEKELRSITVNEAVRFLGRYLQICRFLTSQEEAFHFVTLLKEGDDAEEKKVAKRISALISKLPRRVPVSTRVSNTTNAGTRIPVQHDKISVSFFTSGK